VYENAHKTRGKKKKKKKRRRRRRGRGRWKLLVFCTLQGETGTRGIFLKQDGS
jgi:hypothetical protein